MWRDRHLAGHDMTKTTSEAAIERRDKTIRDLIEELVSGTQQLKALYGKAGEDDTGRD